MNKQDYDSKIDTIKAIEDDRIVTPHNIPVDVYVQEAENLYHWSRNDKDELTAKGTPWELVEDVPVRCGALREAESLWTMERFTREEAAKKWAEDSPLAYDLRDDLLHDLGFAFRKEKELSGRVKSIAEGSSHADMIQDLNDLTVLGKEHPELLAEINFDMARLDQSAQLADDMASLLAAATGNRADVNETKKIRDQAYTHLKEAVDELYAFGQYVFRHNENRLKGYRSHYIRRKRAMREAKKEAAESIPAYG